MNWDKFYEEVYVKQDPRPQDTHGWIQWQGTDVCMDVHCVCGERGHIDGEYVFLYSCPKCGRHYAVGHVVKLIELTKEQSDAAQKEL